MTIPADPIFESALAQTAAHLPGVARGDALDLRGAIDAGLREEFGRLPACPEVSRHDVSFVADDGATLPARWYRPAGSGSGSAVLFFHGGGLIAGSVEIYDPYVAQHVQSSGVPMLSVDYRLSPEATGDTPARDALAAVRWVREHAEELGVDPQRLALMGDSAGGGVAAAAAILARDAGIAIARQILIFPMLDDRTVDEDPSLGRLVMWTHEDNFTGWRALLGDTRGTADVPASAAPARLEDFTGLAPAYIEVGAVDLFRDEDVQYAARLLQAGVQTELHVHPGAPHAYDSMALDSEFATRWRADRTRVLRSI
ncbi:alpha/beta hydrolase [Microbacterium sp. 1P10UB]|uniref:alpha/beta hydrolase n=1 Tax=unclassified Microbacterium TaxID=2609290 RepID=UPI0039A0A6E9